MTLVTGNDTRLRKGDHAKAHASDLVHIVIGDDLGWSSAVAYCNIAVMRERDDGAATCVRCIGLHAWWAEQW